jgi:phage/plasmid-associated DNA primase
LGRFIAECCVERKLAQVKSSVLFTSYQEFCAAAGERWVSRNDFPDEMQRKGFEWKRTNTGGMFYGLELLASEDHRHNA